MSRIALVLGSARGVEGEILEFRKLCPSAEVLAVNDMIYEYPGPLRAALSLHPEKLSRWLKFRASRGFPPPEDVVVHDTWPEWFAFLKRPQTLNCRPTLVTGQMLPGQTSSGSSGLFGVKIALTDLGFDKVIVCGMPMEVERGHLNSPKRKWKGACRHQIGWIEARDALTQVRSMSGWTADLLGYPTKEWLQ